VEFIRFLNGLRTTANSSLLESIITGYQICFESENNEEVSDIENSPDTKVEELSNIDKEYLEAIKTGDKTKARKLLNDAFGIKKESHDIDRGGAHSPADPESGSPAYDVTENETYPKDVYSFSGLQYYGTGEDRMDREAWSILQGLHNSPNKLVRVYRAIEVGDPTTIFPGDWVTTVRAYAKEHGEGTLNGNYKIISKTVNAKDIFTSGDSWLEWGYHPQKRYYPRLIKKNDKGEIIPLTERVKRHLSF
jgi:hypothetical protein